MDDFFDLDGGSPSGGGGSPGAGAGGGGADADLDDFMASLDEL